MRGRPAAEMESSWLVQRLQPPWNAPSVLGRDNPFAFGGGLRNGGLGEEAMDLLRDVFRFDYMGAAEFEWGAVPKALNAIAKRAKHLTAFAFSVPLAEVEQHWKDRSKTPPDGEATVYVLCERAWATEVEARIRQWAAKSYGDLKEATHLPSVLRPSGDYTPDVCGWLELDNGFLFFTDRTMWERTARLFGVKVSEQVAS